MHSERFTWQFRSKEKNIHNINKIVVEDTPVTVVFFFYLWHVEVSLLQQFTNDENVGRGPVSRDVILRCSDLSNERCCWVLNLLRRNKKRKESLKTQKHQQARSSSGYAKKKKEFKFFYFVKKVLAFRKSMVNVIIHFKCKNVHYVRLRMWDLALIYLCQCIC